MNWLVTWKMLSVKWKWRIFFCSLILLFYITYKFNFCKAIDSVVLAEQQQGVLDSMSQKLSVRSIISDTLTGTNVLVNSNAESRKPFMEFISSYSEQNNIEIREISQFTNHTREKYNIETSKILCSGKYNDILRMLHSIEYQSHIAIVNSVNWELIKDKSTDKFVLLATLYIKILRHETDK